MRASSGIRTGTALGLTVVICGLGGLLLAAGLATGFTALERRGSNLTGESGLMRDIDRLESDLRQWGTTVDLVFASSETHFAQDALQQADRIRDLVIHIDVQSIDSQEELLLSVLGVEVQLLTNVEQGALPASLLVASDDAMSRFMTVIDAGVDGAKADLHKRRAELERLRQLLKIIAWIASACYLLVVIMTWRWAAKMFCNPLAQLARTAEEALQSGTPFAAVRRGPREIQQLAAALEAFAGNLECQVEDRTLQLQTMLSELDHRVKNNLATVIALCEQTARGTADQESFQRAFIGRLRAMANAHELLAHHSTGPLDLQAAVDGVLGAWIKDGSNRLQLQGDAVQLPSDAATPICLVLNELATNAAKYGALSNEAGIVQLSWREQDGLLSLDWCESGGPAIEGPPSDRGLGLDLVEGLIQHQLHGTVKWTWAHGGLCCQIAVKQ
jgi:two-component sensor histidine kinase